MNIFCTNPARKIGMIDITHGLVSVYYTMIVRMKSDSQLENVFMNVLQNFGVFGFKLFHIIGLKISEKPYEIFEVENLIKFLNGN